jgi:hypothetical protein
MIARAVSDDPLKYPVQNEDKKTENGFDCQDLLVKEVCQQQDVWTEQARQER